MKITVVIPTYRRSKDLARCLQALGQQTHRADEVLVVIRDTDAETWAFLEGVNLDLLLLRPIPVTASGVVAAMNVGLDAASGDIIVFTDDDAAPHQDWLERIEARFISDHCINGVGGRDWVYFGEELYDGTEQQVVGQLQWFGRMIGNHHLGVGPSREVDILKGVNMSFRRAALAGLRFDERMRGTGAQVHFEVAFCLALRKAGGKLIYDPLVAVDHFQGQRFDEDKRDQFNSLAVTNAVHNETLILLEYLSPAPRLGFLPWAILIGTRSAPGFLQSIRSLPTEGLVSGKRVLASLHGRWQGWQTWQLSRAKKLAVEAIE
jgi:glycosyltransferase involved in cell wall biosynthesis